MLQDPWYRLTFGKHKGLQLSSLIEVDQAYLKFLATGKCDHLLPHPAIEYISNAICAVRLGFGKHRNLTYAEVRDLHGGYLRWLSETPGNEWLKKLLD